jgi:hypothetical protein
MKVGYVLTNPNDGKCPATRIVVGNMAPYLQKKGIETEVLYSSNPPNHFPDVSGIAQSAIDSGIEIVFFQRVFSPSTVREAYKLKEAGIKTVFSVCDHVSNKMVKACDATITVSKYLRSSYHSSLQHKITVIHDGIEFPEYCIDYDSLRPSNGKDLQAVMLTTQALKVIPYIPVLPKGVHLSVIGNYSPGLTHKKEKLTDKIKRKVKNAATVSRDQGIFSKLVSPI